MTDKPAAPDVCTKVGLVLTLLVAGATFIMSICVYLAVMHLEDIIANNNSTATPAPPEMGMGLIDTFRKRQDML